VGDIVFVLRVHTTNHVREHANLEAKEREGEFSIIDSLYYQNMLDLIKDLFSSSSSL
jgi:hypothetical protein